MEREVLVAASLQPGGRPPAPAPLALVQSFVNTVDREHGPDLLDDAAGFGAWLAHRSLAPGVRVGERDLARARAVREALRAILSANNGAALDGDPHAVLDAAAGRAGLRPRFAAGRLEPSAGGVDAALGEILATAFAATADGTLARLKACPGDRCGWAFYDRSVNGSATWCSMRVCGGRAKATAYYRRRRGDAPDAH